MAPKSTVFDYINQAWLIDGSYADCAHPKAMSCGCYGRAHKGEAVHPHLAALVPNTTR